MTCTVNAVICIPATSPTYTIVVQDHLPPSKHVLFSSMPTLWAATLAHVYEIAWRTKNTIQISVTLFYANTAMPPTTESSPPAC